MATSRKLAWATAIIIAAAFSLVLFLFVMPSGKFSEKDKPFTYHHDPRENPAAMKDIIVNPKAVYGFSPNPDSVRLGSYAKDFDWSDKNMVAEMREQRAAYHKTLRELYNLIETMLKENKSVEEIARAASKRRNEIRLYTYANDPEGLKLVMQSNLKTFGHEMGPEPDELFAKYGSWSIVLEKAMSTNAGMDACLGFYDDFYPFYNIGNPQQ